MAERRSFYKGVILGIAALTVVAGPPASCGVRTEPGSRPANIPEDSHSPSAHAGSLRRILADNSNLGYNLLAVPNTPTTIRGPFLRRL